MFEQYEVLAKEQYPDFNFDGWKCGSVMKKTLIFVNLKIMLIKVTPSISITKFLMVM